MSTAKTGDSVRIHYTGRLNDGTVFDSSDGREPLGFTLGSGEVIPGFDQGVAGMDVGETKTIEIPADEAYGAYRDDLALQVGRDQFPDDIAPEVGQQLQLGMADGGTLSVVVTEINDETVTLDANHPLAGQDLTFDLELVSVNG
ncbi:MAG: peptidylprolyl isomerase [Rhodothermaceae bacterium]|nr:peptidylprolyl isomerase [Rhodothermaceae bacterium]